MTFNDELQRHRERERQQRDDAKKEKLKKEVSLLNRRAAEWAWSQRIHDAIVFPLLTQFAVAYGQKAPARKISDTNDPPDVNRCSLEWTDAQQGSFRISFRVEYQTVWIGVRHSRGALGDDSPTIHDNWLDCDDQADDKISDWVRLQLMSAASKIDEHSGG